MTPYTFSCVLSRNAVSRPGRSVCSCDADGHNDDDDNCLFYIFRCRLLWSLYADCLFLFSLDMGEPILRQKRGRGTQNAKVCLAPCVSCSGKAGRLFSAHRHCAIFALGIIVSSKKKPYGQRRNERDQQLVAHATLLFLFENQSPTFLWTDFLLSCRKKGGACQHWIKYN